MIGTVVAVLIVLVCAAIAVRSATAPIEPQQRPGAPEPPQAEAADSPAKSDAAVAEAAVETAPPVSTPATTRTVLVGPMVILEDLGLDDVLAAAAETAAEPRHPALRLAGGIAAAGVVLAGALLLVGRGLDALFGNLLR